MTPAALFLEAEIARESFPGAVALVATPDRILELSAAGFASIEPQTDAVTPETPWDLASLTKPLASGALARAGVGSGLALDREPGFFFPAWKKTRYAGITLKTLLTHTSGLPAWFPLYVRGEGAHAYSRTLAEIEPAVAPGSAVLYSDLNFLLFGDVLEAHFSMPLDRAFAALVAAPAASGARFLPDATPPAAATERGDETERRMTAALGLSYPHFRNGVVRGEVHDGNAFRRGGVAGNAGLFGSAGDVWALARRWLLDFPAEFCGDQTPFLPEARGLSWQGARGAGSAIPRMSERSFGHTGFTGTSVWMDPDTGRIAILLSNRVHPVVKPVDFNEVRRRFHEAVWEC